MLSGRRLFRFVIMSAGSLCSKAIPLIVFYESIASRATGAL
jgi:hypothetical protein